MRSMRSLGGECIKEDIINMLLIFAVILVMMAHKAIKDLTMTEYEKKTKARILKARRAFDERMNQRG